MHFPMVDTLSLKLSIYGDAPKANRPRASRLACLIDIHQLCAIRQAPMGINVAKDNVRSTKKKKKDEFVLVEFGRFWQAWPNTYPPSPFWAIGASPRLSVSPHYLSSAVSSGLLVLKPPVSLGIGHLS